MHVLLLILLIILLQSLRGADIIDRIMEPAAVLVTGIFELFDMYFLCVFRDFSGQSLAAFAAEESGQVLQQ